MIVSSFWQNPAVIGLAVGAPSAALGYLAYRRSVRLDSVAEQAGVAAASATSIGQVVDGLNDIIEHLQESVDRCHKRLDVVEAEGTDLRTKNRELEREVQELRAENKALKREEERLTARILVLENGTQSTP